MDTIFVVIIIVLCSIIIYSSHKNTEYFESKSHTFILRKEYGKLSKKMSKKCRITTNKNQIKLTGSNCCAEIDEKNNRCNSKLLLCSTGMLGSWHYKPKKLLLQQKLIKKHYKNKKDKQILSKLAEISAGQTKDKHSLKKLTQKQAIRLVDKYAKTIPLQNCI